jgi:hypothetical protein
MGWAVRGLLMCWTGHSLGPPRPGSVMGRVGHGLHCEWVGLGMWLVGYGLG